MSDEAALTQLGRLSAVVAHEVRNPLAGFKGSLQVLASRLPSDLPGREIVPPMIARIDALERTVQDILTYSRPKRSQTAALRVHDGDGGCRGKCAGGGARVRRSKSAGNRRVHADPEMCRAVLLNLLLNACQG